MNQYYSAKSSSTTIRSSSLITSATPSANTRSPKQISKRSKSSRKRLLSLFPEVRTNSHPLRQKTAGQNAPPFFGTENKLLGITDPFGSARKRRSAEQCTPPQPFRRRSHLGRCPQIIPSFARRKKRAAAPLTSARIAAIIWLTKRKACSCNRSKNFTRSGAAPRVRTP